MYMTGIRDNDTKHNYSADKRNILLEQGLTLPFIKFGWGDTTKTLKDELKMSKIKMAALLGRKVIDYLRVYTTYLDRQSWRQY